MKTNAHLPLGRTVLAAGMIMMSLLPALAAAGLGEGTPRRENAAQLSDFQLCELDKKSETQIGDCIPAVVPGDVATALWRAGRIPDPYVDLNSQSLGWIDERAWRYETTFDYTPQPGKRARLLFMGIDYIARIEVNGKVMADHEGMFSRVDLDITDVLDPSGVQKLAVIISGVESPNWEKNKGISSIEYRRKKYLKTQMSFDWDFAPRLHNAGLWDRAFLYETGAIRIKDLFVKTELNGEVEFRMELEGPIGDNSVLYLECPCYLDGELDHIKIIFPLEPGMDLKNLVVPFKIPSPRLWWPWDMGESYLYRLKVEVQVDDEISDVASETFAFREITWGPNPDAPKGSADWVLFVNGKREFMRGANWVPPEAMYGRMTDERYDKLLGMAREAGVNMIRIWGGGNRERRAFYDYCDQNGLLVWQEFPFACVYLTGYPRTKHFKDLVRQEAEEMVRQLRNHPSVFLWCGGNEFNVPQNRHVVNILEDVTAKLDPTRIFIPGSPYKGDAHNWVVWHMYGNLSDYFDDPSPLPSEFGLQAWPARATLEKYISPDKLWPVNDVHVHHDLGTDKMNKYLSAISPPDDLDAVIAASQLMQAHYLQRGIEHWRQQKYQTSGTAFWQLNEPWPCISWSVIDYELTPKYAYEVLKNTYNPVLVSASYDDRAWAAGDEFRAEVMVVNDRHESFAGAEITARVCGAPAGSWTVDVGEDTVVNAGAMETPVPADCAEPTLDLTLTHQGRAISQNHYNLWIYDPQPAGKTNRVLDRLGKLIMTGALQPKLESPR